MSLVKPTSTGSKYLQKYITNAEQGKVTGVSLYQKFLGSEGSVDRTIFKITNGKYSPGTNTLWVFLNGQKLDVVDIPSKTTEFREIDSQTIQIGASLLAEDILEVFVAGAYIGGAAKNFIDLLDTPASFGIAGQTVVVNSNRDGLIFVDLPSGGTPTESPSVEIVKPSDMLMDGTMVGVDAGAVFSMIPSVDFSDSTDGAVWFSLDCSGFNTTTNSDMDLSFEYSLNANDPNKNAMIGVSYWCVGEGETPVIGTPTSSNTYLLPSSSNNINKLSISAPSAFRLALTNVSGKKKIIIKFSRFASDANDTFGGLFQLITAKPVLIPTSP